ncbi:MAG: hypothetical protein JW748_14630 [Anaerolineales bacterium]|nr:hypothetical protein [Anaerolineales bacterium]
MKIKAAVVILALSAVIGILHFGLKKNIDYSAMQVFETPHFRVYHSSLADGTKADVENALESAYPRIAGFFSMDGEERTVIVLYPGVEEFQRAYLGHVLSLFYGDWAAGASQEDMVLAASPENPGSEHTYEEILQILVHEYVHSLIYQINEFPNVWLDEGLATFLAGQEGALPSPLPGFAVFQKDDLGAFMDNAGYAVGYSYMEYLDAAYGNEKIILLIRTNDYMAAFGKSAYDVYSEWIRHVETGS